MKIGIVGGGIVGRATARCYLEHVDEVKVWDLKPERTTDSLGDVLKCDVIFVCLPTPQSTTDLSLDTSAVESFFASQRGSPANFVLRSTVPIGTTKRLSEQHDLPNLVHSPEFLTSRCAVTDAQIPSRNVIGHTKRGMRPSECPELKTICDLYAARFPGTRIHVTHSNESEAIKLFTNAFFAVKVGFFNEIYDIAKEKDCDWPTVLEGMLSDGRIAHSHVQVPGPDGSFGFGGECLPKDLGCLIHDSANAALCHEAYRQNVKRTSMR